MQLWSCRLRAPDAVQDFYSEPPDAVFLLAAALQLVAVAITPGFELTPLHPIVRLEGCIAQQVVRDSAHRLHGGSAADCARHCTQFVRGLWATLCTALRDGRARIVRGIARRIAAQITHRGPVPGRKRPLFSS